MDPLSDILRSLRLVGGVFLDAQFTAPWSVATQLTEEHVQLYLKRPAQLICYHVVTEGSLRLSVAGHAPIDVNAGEVVLLPRNDPHQLASEAALPPVSARSLIQSGSDGGLARIVHGGGGAPTRVVCGFLGTEAGFNPLIDALPKVLKLDVRNGLSREWIEASVHFAANELILGRLASSEVMSRLSELLLVEAVRHYSETLGGDASGWLRGLKDPYVGRALALIHQDLARAWTADALARAVALSRSAFSERFTALIGLPPIRYITALRLQTARQHLREGGKTVSQLANLVGYESEEAFSRAFKRHYGLSPMHWRERMHQDPAAGPRQ